MEKPFSFSVKVGAMRSESFGVDTEILQSSQWEMLGRADSRDRGATRQLITHQEDMGFWKYGEAGGRREVAAAEKDYFLPMTMIGSERLLALN